MVVCDQRWKPSTCWQLKASIPDIAVANRKERDNKVFALKILRKVDVIRLKQVEHVRNERNVLAAVVVAGHPFITTTTMAAAFQNLDTLYMLLEYCPGGEAARSSAICEEPGGSTSPSHSSTPSPPK
jgi:serine/threonine protein kinase